MRLSVHFEAPADGGGSEAGPVSVGWLLSDPRGGVIYDAPNRVRGAERGSPVAKSASRCPAVLGLENGRALIRDGVIGDGADIGARCELLRGARVWPGVTLPDCGIRYSSDV